MTQQIINRNHGALFRISEIFANILPGGIFGFSWTRFLSACGISNPEVVNIITNTTHRDNALALLIYFFEKKPNEFPIFATHLFKETLKYNTSIKNNPEVLSNFNIIGYSIENNTIIPLKDSLSSRLSSWPDVQTAYDGVVSIDRTRGPNWERMSIDGLRTTYETLLRDVTRYVQRERFTGNYEEDCVIGKYLHVIEGLGNGYQGEARKNEFDILCWYYRFCSSYGTHSQEVVSFQDAEFAKKVGDLLIDRILVRLNR